MNQALFQNYQIRKPTKVYTPNQAAAGEIYTFFQKEIPFPRIMSMIKQKGRRSVYEVFSEVKKQECQNKLSLFVYKVKKMKVEWK